MEHKCEVARIREQIDAEATKTLVEIYNDVIK